MEKELCFLSTNLFFQTLGKFDQQPFRKSLIKNASQLRIRKALPTTFLKKKP
jgi:hypothetical protein